MKCPACSGYLKQVKAQTGVFDRCEQCKGIWFDEGKFGDFIKHLSFSDKVAPEKVEFFKQRRFDSAYKLGEEKRICPKCDEEMKKFNYAGDSNVFLDKCPVCEGIWADKGESLAIAGYIKGDPRIDMVGSLLAESVKGEEEIERSESNTVTLITSIFLYFPKVILPLGGDMPVARVPVVTISLLVLGVLFFIWQVLMNPESLLIIVKIDPYKKVVSPPLGIFDIDLVTSMFLVGSSIHLLWDMIFLWLFGGNVEDRLGRVEYSLFFVSFGLLAALIYGIFHSGMGMVTVGISGAVAAIMGTYFILYPISTIRVFVIFKVFEIPSAVLLGAWIVLQMVGPFLPIAENVPKTAWVVSIIGFFMGAGVGFVKKSGEE